MSAIKIPIQPEIDQAHLKTESAKAGNTLEKEFEKSGKQSATKFSSGFKSIGIGSALGSLAGGLGVSMFTGIFSNLKEASSLAGDYNMSLKGLAATVKSTGGAAGLSVKELEKMAKGLQQVSNFSAKAVMDGQGMLLTFTNIGKDVFPMATQAMVNMSAKMGTEPQQTAIQLGKALNNPIKGISALTRVGVAFTAEQKKQIKTMQESGDMAGAQKVILKELEMEFGGFAKATAKAGTVSANNLNDLKIKIGTLYNIVMKSLTPLKNALFSGLGDVFDGLATNFATSLKSVFASLTSIIAPIITLIINVFKGTLPVLEVAFKAVTTVLGALGTAIKFVMDNLIYFAPTIIAVGAALIATNIPLIIENVQLGIMAVQLAAVSVWQGIVTAAQWLMNIAMSANPIGIVVIALVALVTAFIVAYKNSEAFRNIVQSVWEWIKNLASIIWDSLVGAFNWLIDKIPVIVKFFLNWLNPIGLLYNGFKKLGEYIPILGKAITFLEETVKSAIKWVTDLFSTAKEDKAGDALSKLTDKVNQNKKAQDEHNKVLKDSKAQLLEIEKQYGKNSNEYKNAKINIEELSKAKGIDSEATNRAKDSMQSAEEKMKSDMETRKKHREAVKVATETLKRAEEQFGKNSGQYFYAKKALDDLTNSTKKHTNAVKEQTAAEKKANEILDEVDEGIEDKKANIEALRIALKKTKKGTEEYTEIQKRLNEALGVKEAKVKSLEDYIKALTKLDGKEFDVMFEKALKLQNETDKLAESTNKIKFQIDFASDKGFAEFSKSLNEGVVDPLTALSANMASLDLTSGFTDALFGKPDQLKQAIQERLDLLQQALEQGNITAKEYNDKKKQIIDEETASFQQGLDVKKEAQMKFDQEIADNSERIAKEEFETKKDKFQTYVDFTTQGLDILLSTEKTNLGERLKAFGLYLVDVIEKASIAAIIEATIASLAKAPATWGLSIIEGLAYIALIKVASSGAKALLGAEDGTDFGKPLNLHKGKPKGKDSILMAITPDEYNYGIMSDKALSIGKNREYAQMMNKGINIESMVLRNQSNLNDVNIVRQLRASNQRLERIERANYEVAKRFNSNSTVNVNTKQDINLKVDFMKNWKY